VHSETLHIPAIVRLQVLSQMTRDLRTMRQKLYREHLAAKPDWLPAHHKSVAVAIYILSGHAAQVAAECCAQQNNNTAAKTHWAVTVVGWYLAKSIDDIVALQHPEKLQGIRSARAACRWLAERHTAHWVRDQSFSFGVAPSSADMVEKIRQLSGETKGDTTGKSTRSGRRTCQSLCKKWGVRLGTLQVRDEMADHTIRNNVRWGMLTRVQM
jgi:hypothetical protein